jgi:NTE family protein
VRGIQNEPAGLRSLGGADAYPSPADTAGLFFNAVFAEALETDIERLERVNQTVSLLPQSTIARQRTQLRKIPLFVLRPSCNLGALAKGTLTRLPTFVQYLFRGLGVSSTSGLDLLSYLAFDAAYASRLMEVGHADVMAKADVLMEFLTTSSDDAPVTHP